MIPRIKEFKDSLVEQYTSPHGISNVLKATGFFMRIMKIKDIGSVSDNDIKKYSEYLKSGYLTHEHLPLNDGTIIFRLRSVSMYFKFLYEKKYIASDPTGDLKLPAIARINQDRLLTKEEIEEFASKPDPYSYVGIRDRAVIRLCYSCPLRSIDYKDLNVEDVDIKNKLLYPKGARVPLDSEACKTMEKYLTVTRPVFLKRAKKYTDRLFLGKHGAPFKVSNIYGIFCKYNGGKRIHPYSLRYYRVFEMLKNGGGVKDIRALFGHKCYKTIDSYTIFTIDNTKELDSRFQKMETHSIAE